MQDFQMVEGSLSQAFQESFVLNALSFKREGYFLEIGGADGLEASNTYLLEKEFGWIGLAAELDTDLHAKYKAVRSTECVCVDATSWDPTPCLKQLNFPKQIDYLQVDIDPASQSLKALINLPFNEYRFSVITFEHDYYIFQDSEVRELSRNFLQAHGYHLVVAGVETQGRNFEDWWVDPNLVELSSLTSFRYDNVEARSFFLPR